MLPPGNERYPPTLCDDKIKAPSKFRWLNSCPVVYTDGTKIHTASAARFYSNVTFNRDGSLRSISPQLFSHLVAAFSVSRGEGRQVRMDALLTSRCLDKTMTKRRINPPWPFKDLLGPSNATPCHYKFHVGDSPIDPDSKVVCTAPVCTRCMYNKLVNTPHDWLQLFHIQAKTPESVMLAIFRPLFAEKQLREQLAGIVWPGPEENVVIRGKIGTWSAPLLCIANPKMATSYMSVVARPIDAALCRDVSVLFHRKSQAFLEAADNIDALWSDGWATTPNFLVKMDHMRRVVEFHQSACLTGEFAYCIRRLKTISVRLVRSGKMHLRLPALQATEDVAMHGCERMTWGSLAAVLSETGLDCCHPPSHGLVFTAFGPTGCTHIDLYGYTTGSYTDPFGRPSRVFQILWTNRSYIGAKTADGPRANKRDADESEDVIPEPWPAPVKAAIEDDPAHRRPAKGDVDPRSGRTRDHPGATRQA